MSDAAEQLSAEAEALMEGFRQLPIEEQRRFAQRAIAVAAPPDLSPAWKAEIASRLKSIEDGSAVLLDGDEVMAELRAKFDF